MFWRFGVKVCLSRTHLHFSLVCGKLQSRRALWAQAQPTSNSLPLFAQHPDLVSQTVGRLHPEHLLFKLWLPPLSAVCRLARGPGQAWVALSLENNVQLSEALASPPRHKSGHFTRSVTVWYQTFAHYGQIDSETNCLVLKASSGAEWVPPSGTYFVQVLPVFYYNNLRLFSVNKLTEIRLFKFNSSFSAFACLNWAFSFVISIKIK